MRGLLREARLCIIGLAAVIMPLAGLGCTPDLSTIFQGETVESPGEEGFGPSQDDIMLPPQPVTPTPSLTPSPTPTNLPPPPDGVMERAFYDPAADMGPPDEYDAFDGSNPLFFERFFDTSAFWYGTDDRYHITYTRPGNWTWHWTNVYGDDFYVDVLVFNSDHCVARDSGGLIFRGRLDLDAGYLFGVTCDGSYFIGATMLPGSGGVICWIGNGDDTNCDPGAAASSVVPSEYINAGPGAVNRLGVLVEGTFFTYYINGHQVESITRTQSMLYEGYFTLYLGTGQGNTAEAIFDDFSVWHLP